MFSHSQIRDESGNPMKQPLLFGKSVDQWIEEYSVSHQHPLNKLCHLLGIPMIVLSLVVMPLGLAWSVCFYVGLVLFVSGWALQFIGHAIEGKPPEFFRDWRFLLVGLRWWLRKITGKSK
jgi:uncharacterized membrane protein YGL010W